MVNLKEELPDDLPALIDEYKACETLRKAMEGEVKPVKEREIAAKNKIQQLLVDQDITAAAGTEYLAKRTEKRVASVKDWDAFYDWLQESGRFDLMPRSVNNRAVLDMWEADEDVPGLEPALAIGLSVTKL